MARIALSFDAWKDGHVAPAVVEVPVAVVEVTDSPQHRATLRGHTDPVRIVAFSPDGATLATCTYQDAVKLWDAASGKERRTLQPSGGPVGDLAFLPDCQMLALSWYEAFGAGGRTLTPPYAARGRKGYRGGVKLWDVATGKERRTLRREMPRGVGAIALSPDGKTLAVNEFWYEDDGKKYKTNIALWDVPSGKVRADLGSGTFSLAFAPDGKTLAIGCDGGVQLWDVATGRQRGKLSGEDKQMWPRSLAFAPDGKMLAGCDNRSGMVFLWDLTTGKVKVKFQPDEMRRAFCIAFSPKDMTLAVGLITRNANFIEPGEIVLWDAAAARKRLTLRGHVGDVLSVAFSPDGKLLASGGEDKTVKLWNVAPPAAGKP